MGGLSLIEDNYAYILVEYEPYWKKRIEQHRKGVNNQAFVRRGKVGPKDANTLLFYVKFPVGEVKGYGEFLERISGASDELWNKYGSETVFESKDGYDEFVEGRDKVTLVRFKNLQELDKPLPWKDLAVTLGIKKMPNGGRYISRETLNSLLKKEL
jgi:predicted transcriptional regulator